MLSITQLLARTIFHSQSFTWLPLFNHLPLFHIKFYLTIYNNNKNIRWLNSRRSECELLRFKIFFTITAWLLLLNAIFQQIHLRNIHLLSFWTFFDIRSKYKKYNNKIHSISKMELYQDKILALPVCIVTFTSAILEYSRVSIGEMK